MEPANRPVRYSSFPTGLEKKSMWLPSRKSRRAELATKAVTTNSPNTVSPAISRRITKGALWFTAPGRLSMWAAIPVETNIRARRRRASPVT
jgi:hypothetical protein